MSVTTIIIIVAVVAVIAILGLRSGPRVTEIRREVVRRDENDDA